MKRPGEQSGSSVHGDSGGCWLAIVALVVLSLGVRTYPVLDRSAYYDEAITLLEVSGHASPDWPAEPRPAGEVASLMRDFTSLAAITKGIYTTDVHPPLYYIVLALWRQVFGTSLIAARALSAVASTLAVLAIYRLCQKAGLSRPFVPAALYSLSTGAVWASAMARNYALASLLFYAAVLAAWTARGAPAKRTMLAGASCAVLCGLVIHTHYLAAFPVAALLLWWLATKWRYSRVWALAVPVLASAIAALGAPQMLAQSGTRASQWAGYPGLATDIFLALSSSLSNIVTGVTFPTWARSLLYMVVLLLVVRAALELWWDKERRPFWALALVLAVAPTLGILATDWLAGKHVAIANSYLILSGPALAILLSAGLHTSIRPTLFTGGEATELRLKRISRPSAMVMLLCALLAAMMLASHAWGKDLVLDWPGDSYKTIVSQVHDSLPDDGIIVLGAGYGRGQPGAYLLELRPQVTVQVLTLGADVASFARALLPYRAVWLLVGDIATASEEQVLVDYLTQTAGYVITCQDFRLICMERLRGP